MYSKHPQENQLSILKGARASVVEVRDVVTLYDDVSVLYKKIRKCPWSK
jgi:hypothetical protein